LLNNKLDIASKNDTLHNPTMTSAKPFGTVPAGAKQQPTPFELQIEDQKIEDLKTLLRLSPVAKETYENLQDDGSHGKLGVSRKWVVEAKKYWEDDFDWYVSSTVLSTSSFIQTVINS
jgi:microsomal epoxide hydrolase